MTETVILPKIEFVFTPVVNDAIQQNRIPLIRKLSIENFSDFYVNADLFQKDRTNINTSITKRTDLIITGSAPGPSRMKKIEQYNSQGGKIRIIFEDEF